MQKAVFMRICNGHVYSRLKVRMVEICNGECCSKLREGPGIGGPHGPYKQVPLIIRHGLEAH